MRFFAALALFGAIAAAAEETVSIKDLSIREENGSVSWASLTIVEPDVKCSASAADFGDSVTVCGETKYRFGVKGSGESKFTLTIAKETGLAVGIMGSTEVQPYCHAGGNGAIQCAQTGDISVTMRT
ncbi:hypothetical protein B0J12DRAFT_723763 [Macrophomina phaseolina]|uniref:AA1-like domain-containing protein n=1 Tax=Macrophomina phaseolina TaxID=35725 RepID=A0ABQ8GRY2_9PEZI|nr:hypothetical protein B0J12DRAFT_723763 [Macrophomina phaseolina]